MDFLKAKSLYSTTTRTSITTLTPTAQIKSTSSPFKFNPSDRTPPGLEPIEATSTTMAPNPPRNIKGKSRA